MAEAGLSLGYPDFQVVVAEFLGFDPYGSWTADTTDRRWKMVDRYIQSGYRQFLNPPPAGQEQAGHTWSFMQPGSTSLSLVSGNSAYDCPDDFGGLDGDMIYPASENVGLARVVQRSVGLLERLIAGSDEATGPPRYVAVRAKAVAGSSGQRFEFLVWPIPETARTLNYRYSRFLDSLSSSSPYPVGGSVHAETIQAFCVAAAESGQREGRGAKWAEAMERLVASVSYDRTHFTADSVGYNTDGGAEALYWERGRSLATYKGLYTDESG